MNTQAPVAGECHDIAPGVRRLTAPNPGPMTGPGTNTYILGDDEIVVLDPGVDDKAHLSAIVAEAPGPISQVLVTHKHPDHTGGAAELSAMTGAPVLGEATPLAGVYDPDFALDDTLTHGQIMTCGGYRLEAVYTPGHTPDHLCFLLREQGLLFAGDAVMADVTVVIIPPDGDMRTYFDTLETLQHVPMSAIAPAHGRVLDEPVAEVEHIITHRAEREAQVLNQLAEDSGSTAELAQRIYPEVPESLRGMAQAQLAAHLFKLEADGCVHRIGDQRWTLNT